MTAKQQLPIGIDSFEKIITENYLYIDKTELIYRLITTRDYCFFTRPRRFGKSLLISTLEALFKGSKNLFKDLWIGKNTSYDWKPYPVIRLDMSRIKGDTPKELENCIGRLLDFIAETHQIDIRHVVEPVEKITYLIELLAARDGKVVVLIDEYDYLVTNAINDDINDQSNATARANIKVLHDFYIGLKSTSAQIHFLFITGVGRFSQTSLFSALNNLKDLSFLPTYAALAGYTESEITKNFTPYIADMMQARKLSEKNIAQEMRTWYNGYHFSKSALSVYNPYSILYYFDDEECSNYWFKTGTPTFLTNFIKKKVAHSDSLFSLESLNHCRVTDRFLTNSSLDTINLEALFYQTGYLTIESYDRQTNAYILTFPNLEVESSLGSDLLGAFLNKPIEAIESTLFHMRNALFNQNIPLFSAHLKALLTGLPYQLHVKKEAYYHSLFDIIGKLLGFDVQSEVMVSTGRIDMIITMPTLVYIIEFKLNGTAQEALEQIKNNHYADAYSQSKKKTVLVGCNFEVAEHVFDITWVVE